MTYIELCASQVEWYLVNGKYPMDRIATDEDGVNYVIGDASWNNGDHPGQREYIESIRDFKALSRPTKRAVDCA